MNSLGIYIHVPFCAVKCPYCDFYSCSYSREKAEKYTQAVIRDIEEFDGGAVADTVYFGGGTPSLIPTELTEKILSAIRHKFTLITPEITLEVNPCTVNRDKLLQYYSMGINRLSVGVQSANDDELKLLGRSHTFDKARQVILDAHQIGFDNISADLMTGLPFQTFESLENSIEKLSILPLTHISNYILKIEKGTPFDNPDFTKNMPDDDFVSDMYLHMVDCLAQNGFAQYEISNFSKKGFESRHNLKYWNCREYIGFGPAAHSFCKNIRYCYSPNLESFINSSPEKIITDENAGNDEEKIMLALRLAKGININDYPDRKEILLKKIKLFEKTNLINFDGESLSLSPNGFLVSNSITEEFTNKY